jgi:transposase
MSKKRRIFSCPQCGHRYEVYPPSDEYDSISWKHPDKREYDESIGVSKVIHDCPNEKCMKPIELYWYRHKGFFDRT